MILDEILVAEWVVAVVIGVVAVWKSFKPVK